MPATITHAIFAEDIYKNLPKKYQRIISKEKTSLLMFAQSTDPMMFYSIFSIKTPKNLLDFSHTFHTTNTNLFFTNLITYMKKEKSYLDPQTLAYLYGFICHFCLDSTCHPYIFYKTGIFNKLDKTTYKYNGLHNEIETYLDNVILKKVKLSQKQIKFKKFCFDLKPFSDSLTNCINDSFLKTYKISNMAHIYKKALTKMAYALDFFRIDKYGIKKFSYQILDKLKPKTTMQLKYLSYYPYTPKRDYLNESHKSWYYPTNKNNKKNESFFDLYSQALKQANQIIHKVNQYLFNDTPIFIDKIFQNKSYVTGLDCDNKDSIQYFEF